MLGMRQFFVGCVLAEFFQFSEGAPCVAATTAALQACKSAFDKTKGTTGTTICPALAVMIKCSNTAAGVGTVAAGAGTGTATGACQGYTDQAGYAITQYNQFDCGNIMAEASRTQSQSGGSLGGSDPSNAPLLPPTPSPNRQTFKNAGVNLAGANNCGNALAALNACWAPLNPSKGFNLIGQSAASLCPQIDAFIRCHQTKAAGGMLVCDDAAAIFHQSQVWWDQFKCATYNSQNGITNEKGGSLASSGSGSSVDSSGSLASGASADSFNASGSGGSLGSMGSLNATSGSLTSSDSSCGPGCWEWMTLLVAGLGACLLCCCTAAAIYSLSGPRGHKRSVDTGMYMTGNGGGNVHHGVYYPAGQMGTQVMAQYPAQYPAYTPLNNNMGFQTPRY